jgi:VanZ family protein
MWALQPQVVLSGDAGPRFCRLNPHQKNVLKTWIAAILWLIVISVESSSLGAATNTGRILFPVLHFLFGISPERFEPIHFFIRKGGHVFGYGLLSILLFRAWRETLPVLNSRWIIRWANLAVLGTLLVASLDEWHQSFNPLRTGTPKDVVLDTCAGIVAQILILLWVRCF